MSEVASPIQSHKKDGTIYYHKIGDRVSDYTNRKISPFLLNYNTSQRTLIIGECDFSFTAAIIQKRHGGMNCCSTAWCYYTQWIKKITKEIGVHKLRVFINNLNFCQNNHCNVTFGIDGKCIASTESQWNDALHSKFDRIIYTFPRVYQCTQMMKISDYNTKNETLLFDLLKAAKKCLSTDGEMQVMLFKDQFLNWKLKPCLDRLNMELYLWCDVSGLQTIFAGYTPRDTFGNYMKLTDSNGNPLTIYMCCFRVKYWEPKVKVLRTVYVKTKLRKNENTASIEPKEVIKSRHMKKYTKLGSIEHLEEKDKTVKSESSGYQRGIAIQNNEFPWHTPPRFWKLKQKQKQIKAMDSKSSKSQKIQQILNFSKLLKSKSDNIVVERNLKRRQKRRPPPPNRPAPSPPIPSNRRIYVDQTDIISMYYYA